MELGLNEYIHARTDVEMSIYSDIMSRSKLFLQKLFKTSATSSTKLVQFDFNNITTTHYTCKLNFDFI